MPGRLTAWSITEWVAVMAVARESDELLGRMEPLVELWPEGAVLARVGAHEGLAEALGVDAGWWYCGVAVDDRDRLDEVTGVIGPALGCPPLVAGPFRLLRLVD